MRQHLKLILLNAESKYILILHTDHWRQVCHWRSDFALSYSWSISGSHRSPTVLSASLTQPTATFPPSVSWIWMNDIIAIVYIVGKQETLTPPGHLVSPLVCRGLWMSTVVLYCWCHNDGASVLFCIGVCINTVTMVTFSLHVYFLNK